MKQFLQKIDLTKKQLGIMLGFLILISVFLSGFIFLPLSIAIVIVGFFYLTQ